MTPIQIIWTTLWDLFLAMGLPLAGVMGLTFINRESKRLLGNTWGIKAEIYLGGLGVAIHELSHLIMALIFGHRITKVKLLVMPWQINRQSPDEQGALGYVSHVWDDNNFYQSIGNALIGTAPIWGCSLVLILLTKGLVPEIYQGYQFLSQNLSNQNSLAGTLRLFPLAIIHMTAPTSFRGILRFIIWALLSVNITVGGFDLSPADFKNARMALIELFGILVVIFSLLSFWGLAGTIAYWLGRYLIWLMTILVLSFVWSVVSLIVCLGMVKL